MFIRGAEQTSGAICRAACEGSSSSRKSGRGIPGRRRRASVERPRVPLSHVLLDGRPFDYESADWSSGRLSALSSAFSSRLSAIDSTALVDESWREANEASRPNRLAICEPLSSSPRCLRLLCSLRPSTVKWIHPSEYSDPWPVLSVSPFPTFGG